MLKVLMVSALALVLTNSAAAAEAEGREGELSGSVRRAGAGAAGILLEVHLEARGAGGANRAIAAAESGEAGTFVMSLPAGEYYLAAKVPSSQPGPPIVFEHPENPFNVRAGERTEIGPLVLSAEGEERISPLTGVRGRILIDGAPAPGAFVMIYDGEVARPVGPRYRERVESGTEGRFEAALPPGSYLVAVRKRQRGAAVGPPQPGDYTAEYEENPVSVESGRYTETGDISLHVVDLAKLDRRLRNLDNSTNETSSIRGRVVGPEGEPLPGRFVFLYRIAEMTGPPVFMTRSGEAGSFVLNPPGSGKYYVVTRQAYGAARQLGEEVGLIEGRPDSSVDVGEGEAVGGLVLRVKEVR